MKFKRNRGLINLVEEISKKSNVQDMAWVLLASFSENQEKIDVKNLQFYCMRSTCKVKTKECMVDENVSIKRSRVLCIRIVKKRT